MKVVVFNNIPSFCEADATEYMLVSPSDQFRLFTGRECSLDEDGTTSGRRHDAVMTPRKRWEVRGRNRRKCRIEQERPSEETFRYPGQNVERQFRCSTGAAPSTLQPPPCRWKSIFQWSQHYCWPLLLRLHQGPLSIRLHQNRGLT